MTREHFAFGCPYRTVKITTAACSKTHTGLPLNRQKPKHMEWKDLFMEVTVTVFILQLVFAAGFYLIS